MQIMMDTVKGKVSDCSLARSSDVSKQWFLFPSRKILRFPFQTAVGQLVHPHSVFRSGL
jgi:hypothetical protein